MGGRHILDVALNANEAIDLRKSSSNAGLVFKLDIGKAIYHISWKFLMLVFEKMGVGPKWR